MYEINMFDTRKRRRMLASLIVLVKKKDRTTHFCVDYRKPNSVSQMDAYPMPRVDDLNDRLGTAKYIHHHP